MPTPRAKTPINEKYSVTVNGKKFDVEVADADGKAEIKSVKPASVAHMPPPELSPAKTTGGSGEPVKSTLPGNVFKILVAVGDSVKKGQRMFVLEAMKMEIDVNAPKDGLVTSIEVQQGQTVANGQILAKI